MTDPTRHLSPARGFAADDVITVSGETTEVIDAHRLPDGSLEICAIPFLVRGLALGDVVRWEDSDLEVVSRSGHGTIWVWLGDSFHPRAEIAERILDSGGLIEWRDENWLAVDVAAEVADCVLGAITEMEADEALSYRIARYVPMPPPGAPTELDEQAMAAIDALRPAFDADTIELAATAVRSGKLVHAFDLIFNSFTDEGPVLDPDQFALLINTATALGIPWERVPAQLVSYQAPPDAAGALGVILSRAGRWATTQFTWPGHQPTAIKFTNTQAGESGFAIGDPTHLIRVVGPVVIAANEQKMRLTDFDYAQLFTVHRPWHTWCEVITDEPITISAAGPPAPTIPGTDTLWTAASAPGRQVEDQVALRRAVRRTRAEVATNRNRVTTLAVLFTLLGVALVAGSPGLWAALVLGTGSLAVLVFAALATYDAWQVRQIWSGFVDRGFLASLHPIVRMDHQRARLYYFSPKDQPFDPAAFPTEIDPDPLPGIIADLRINAAKAKRADLFTDAFPPAYLALRSSAERTDLAWVVVPRKHDPLTADLLWVDPDRLA